MAPVAKIKQEKKEAVDNLASDIKKAKSLVMVDYSGMGMSALSTLREKLTEAGARMIVAKNTLINLAGKKAEISDEVLSEDILTGQTALIFANEDAISPIQALGKFIKEFEAPKLKAGIIEGKFLNETGLLAISKLPTREVLAGQVVGAIAGPMYGLVGTLEGNLQKLIYILKSKADKGGD
ncbi:MAG: 50S ribosomal protein L10 [Candidatus Woesebacteria bacterium GW2011_GWB1_43_14]|uniref:Large ribosomal subunit protein uL10 n=1 Tax=Candidatus Woesebacteria bacterium GW2011_GWB1_43_14 TaxID=1618578 RepID=A0A0G1GDF3_9BACT|nr:MAG: 50S ribosomal protein L10 [Candidatus Woesebacteria bacterium GW2011_GWC1_42_9]KKS96913.1 MAG: 50S ribosomal protein L10 [Candidatus Woesebacteria bacterium GW2011_GWB1_43_14]